MSPETIGSLIGMAGAIIGMIFAIIGNNRNDKKDTKEGAKELAEISTNINHLIKKQDDMNKTINTLDSKIDNIKERTIKLETKLDQHVDNKLIHTTRSRGGKSNGAN